MSIRRRLPLAAACMLWILPEPAAAQLLSTRSEALAPALAGLFPDDWSDAVLNPSTIASGGLAFARLDWTAADSAGRQVLLGGRATVEPVGVLMAGSRALEKRAGFLPAERTMVGLRYGRGDAVGARYTAYRGGPTEEVHDGYAVGAGARSAAGKGWSVEFLAELAGIRSTSRPEGRFRAGELVLRQPGPERDPQAVGWDQRLLRLRGGVGTGALLRRDAELSIGDDVVRWIEASLVHLHGFERGDARFALAWAARFTHYEKEAGCAAPCSTPSPLVGRRHALALDAGLEARLVPAVALRGGGTWAAHVDGDEALPTYWRRVSSLVPAGFGHGLWLGLGWDVSRGMVVDVAMDAGAGEHALEQTPFSLQATYRF